MNYPAVIVPKRNKRGFFIRLALFQVALLATLIITQIGIQFAQTHKWVGFARKDQSTWIGIAETAQADNWTCQQQLEEMKKARNDENADIMQPLNEK